MAEAEKRVLALHKTLVLHSGKSIAWSALCSDGVSTPISFVELLGDLIFINRLDEIYTCEESQIEMLGAEMDHPICPEEADENAEAFRCHRWCPFKNVEACNRQSSAEMPLVRAPIKADNNNFFQEMLRPHFNLLRSSTVSGGVEADIFNLGGTI